jgi:Protein of unknown function (DUF3293)
MSKPPVFIRTLEDSPPWLDQQLVLAYLNTQYQVQMPEKTSLYWEIGQSCGPFWEYLTQQKLATAAIITAFNPRSFLLDAATNFQRHQQLATRLRCMPLVLPSKSISADGQWPDEHGFCIGGIQLPTVVSLALEFEQNAVVWCDDAVPTLLFPDR